MKYVCAPSQTSQRSTYVIAKSFLYFHVSVQCHMSHQTMRQQDPTHFDHMVVCRLMVAL